MFMLSYFKNLINVDKPDSSKSFGLVLSAIIGALIGLCVCVVLIYDVLEDGVVGTDLENLGWFLLCSGFYMFGGGLNKTLSEIGGSVKRNKKTETHDKEEISE